METIELWEILSSYPTSIYTVLIGVLLVFWLFTIIGAVDLDIISFDSDINFEVDDVEIPGFVGLLHTLGLTGVPFTIVITVIIFLAWVFTYIVSAYILPYVPTTILKVIVGTVTLAGGLILAAPITSKIVAPLRKLTLENRAKSNKDFLGGICKVTSLTVDETFGQGQIETTGASLNVRIRAPASDGIKKGDIVRPISYDDENNLYHVITNKEFENNLDN